MNKQIYSLLGSIGASPYMTGAKRLNSQYAGLETLYEQRAYAGCVAACSALFEQLMSGLYLSVTGEKGQLALILSDIAFWEIVGDKGFCDTAQMLQYACYRLTEETDADAEPEKAARLARSGLDDIIEYTSGFLSKQGGKKCLDPVILRRDGVRERICRLTDSLRAQMEAAGCSDGFSMQPPFMNACLLNFPEKETAVWARFLGMKLQRAGLLSSSELDVLDAEWVVDERVGLTNEFIRRSSAGANGGVLLIEHFEEFDMSVAGGNLLDRAMKTIITAADTYRGSMCIVVAGEGEHAEKAVRRAERSEECFPLILSLKEA